MNFKSAIILSGLVATSLAANAQGLHKEIDVDSKVDPVKREASRFTILPSLQLPSPTRPQLSFSDRVVSTTVPNTSPLLAPTAYGDKLYTSPYRGYVVAGLGTPIFNATFSAGYRAIATDKTSLNLWSQYDGDVYRNKITEIIAGAPIRRDYINRDHSASLGAQFNHAVGNSTTLNAALDYTFASHTNPQALDEYYTQNFSRVYASALLSANKENVVYTAGLHYQHFGTYHVSHIDKTYSNIPEKGIRQNLFGAEGSIALPFGDEAFIALDANVDVLKSGNGLTPTNPFTDVFTTKSSSTSGLISLTPHYDISTSTVKTSIGLQVDYSTGVGNNFSNFHIAPEIKFAWTPSQQFGIEATATGGSTLNSRASLYDITPYIAPYTIYDQSHVPFDINARFTVGPFAGAYLQVFGGYAKADNWLMPVDNDYINGYLYGVFAPVDLSAWHLGAAVGYDYKDIASLRASYETAPNDYDNAYYKWRDYAKHVFDLNLKVRPIAPLTVAVDWQFRAGRCDYSISDMPSAIGTVYTCQPRSLGVVSNLSLEADYAVTDRLNVFGRGENLLNRRFHYLGHRYAQGTTVMVGAALKF